MRIAIAVTRAANIDVTWTTSYMIAGALARGHQVRLIEPWDFEVDSASRLLARTWAFDRPLKRTQICADLRSRTARRCYVELNRIDLLLLRINPMDTAILSFASLVERAGIPVLHSPAALIRTCHKSYLASLSGVASPRTLVTRSSAAIHAFAAEERAGVVIKPARSSGGRAVSWVRPRDRASLDAAIATARRRGDGYLVAQEYLPDAERGEKRLVWLDGTLLGGYLRRRAPGEFRHNLKQGGLPEPCELRPEDHALVADLSPHLKRDGIWLAGIDMIGDRIVEVNVLNPGGLHLIQQFSDDDLVTPVLESLERRVSGEK